MATKTATEAELAAALNDREAKINTLTDQLRSMTRDRDEHRDFQHNSSRDRDEAIAALMEIIKIHVPFYDPSNFVRGENRDNEPWGITMRCAVCKTPEHHTRGERNSEVWPCPTVKPILRLREEWERAQADKQWEAGVVRNADATQLENLLATSPWQRAQEWRDSLDNTWNYFPGTEPPAWRLFSQTQGKWVRETPDSAFGPFTRIEP